VERAGGRGGDESDGEGRGRREDEVARLAEEVERAREHAQDAGEERESCEQLADTTEPDLGGAVLEKRRHVLARLLARVLEVQHKVELWRIKQLQAAHRESEASAAAGEASRRSSSARTRPPPLIATMKQAARQTLHAAARRHARPAPRPAAFALVLAGRPFSSSPLRLQDPAADANKDPKGDAKDSKDGKAKDKANAEPDSTVEGRSPFAAFVEVLRDEVRKNREWQDSVKQLGGEVSKVQDSEAMQRAKIMYERARVRPLFAWLPLSEVR